MKLYIYCTLLFNIFFIVVVRWCGIYYVHALNSVQLPNRFLNSHNGMRTGSAPLTLWATTINSYETRPYIYDSRNNTSSGHNIHRFDRAASQIREVDNPCVLLIDGRRYNVTAWAKAHPGGVAILEKFHNRDASKAFHAAHHSKQAIAMLQQFLIPIDDDDDTQPTNGSQIVSSTSNEIQSNRNNRNIQSQQRWRIKLFTKEDPIGIHKYLGIFVLLHFMYRYYQMLCTDPSAGLGTRLGRGYSYIPLLCLLPHGILSVSSLIFHTVPRDRVIGQPMIWQEYRIHNIGFGLRSVVNAMLCSLSIRYNHTPIIRTIAVIGSCISCIMAMLVADLATKHLRSNTFESTTATMPYWDGCSITTQKRFKLFYAYCQFMATIGCITVSNPAFPLAILLAIQLASLLMTLVRKGLLSTYGYHMGYTASLIAPYFVAFRSTLIMQSPEMIYLFILGSILFQLRRQGVNKYVIWIPVMLARIVVGDKFVTYNIW